MRTTSSLLALTTMLSLLAGGCQQGFKTADDLESDERGPKACSQSCSDLGMHMSAFVLFEHEHSGCVCSPGAKTNSGDDGSTAVAAGHAVLMQRQQQQSQQEAQRASNQ